MQPQNGRGQEVAGIDSGLHLSYALPIGITLLLSYLIASDHCLQFYLTI